MRELALQVTLVVSSLQDCLVNVFICKGKASSLMITYEICLIIVDWDLEVLGVTSYTPVSHHYFFGELTT